MLTYTYMTARLPGWPKFEWNNLNIKQLNLPY